MYKKYVIILLVFFLITVILGLVLFDSIGGLDWYSIWEYRIHRIPMIVIMGSGTTVSGLLIQKLTRNRLADTGLIGIADSGMIILSIISVLSPLLLNPFRSNILFSIVIPLVIFGSSFITMIAIYFMSKLNGSNPRRIILMGLGLHILFQAISGGIIYFNNGYTQTAFYRYLIGFIEKKPFNVWIMSLLGILFVFIATMMMSKKIDTISMGQKFAIARGENIKLITLLSFILIALVVSFTITSVGSVSVLGLIAPNLARKIVGDKTAKLLPVSIIIGVIITSIAQFININLLHIMAPTTIIIQLCLAPYFIFMLLNKKERG